MGPQRHYCHNDQGRQEERYGNTERNQCAGRPNHRRHNNDPYLDEDEQEEEEYPSNERYNPQGWRRHDNRCTTNNRGGQAEPRTYGGNQLSWNQCYNEEISEEERRHDSRREYRHKPRNNGRFQRTQEEQTPPMETTATPIVEKGESNVHCFVCQQLGHYTT